MLRFSVNFEESEILPAKDGIQEWKCWLWDVHETFCQCFYTTVHGQASLFQSWRSVRGVTTTFHVNRRRLPGLTFRSDLLWMGLAGTGGSGRKPRNTDARCGLSSSIVCMGQILYNSHILMIAMIYFRLFVCCCLKLKWCFTSTETVGLLGTGAQDVHFDFHANLLFFI